MKHKHEAIHNSFHANINKINEREKSKGMKNKILIMKVRCWDKT